MTDTNADTDKAATALETLTRMQRIMALELALDTLTIQIADPVHLVAAAEFEIKLLQNQVRLVASQIRSYEKLEALKKTLGLANGTTEAVSTIDPQITATGTGVMAVGAVAAMSRAERRRRKRAETKNQKKNKPNLMNGASVSSALAVPAPVIS